MAKRMGLLRENKLFDQQRMKEKCIEKIVLMYLGIEKNWENGILDHSTVIFLCCKLQNSLNICYDCHGNKNTLETLMQNVDAFR